MIGRAGLGGIAFIIGCLALPGAASAQSAACEPGYRIQRGDTLAGLARACDIAPDALRRANPRIDWDLLRIGAPVVFPESRRAAPRPRGPAEVYVVQRGDTLRSVARALGVDVDALLDANPGLRERDLVPGREIRLGGGLPSSGPSRGDIDLSVRERSVEPGGFVTVEVEGLPPRASVVLRTGPDGGRPFVQATGRAGRDGTATVELDIPERARAGERWRVDAVDPRGRSVASGTFRVETRGGRPGRPGRDGIEVSGLLTREGVECPALRSEDGELYTLTGRLGGFRAGDAVTVTGRVAGGSACQQGTTIEVQRIEEAR